LLQVSDMLFTGPSHAHRLRHAARTRQLPAIFGDVVGVGGMPIWSPRIKPYLDQYKMAFHVVGDFRFGNRALSKYSDSGDIVRSGEEFLAIDKDHISPDGDAIMRDAALISLREMSRSTKNKFLFWDLSIREGENRASGHYINDGSYRHPTWNLSDVLDEFPNSSVDTRDLAGWIYIAQKSFGVETSLDEIRNNLRSSINDVFGVSFLASPIKSVLICGNSKFCRILKRYDAADVLPLPSEISVDIHLSTPPDANLILFFPPSYGGKNAQEEANRIAADPVLRKLRESGKPFRVIPYDVWASEKISSRIDYIRGIRNGDWPVSSKGVDEYTHARGQTFRISDLSRYGGMIEFGDALLPTARGIIEILAGGIFQKGEHHAAWIYEAILAKLFAT
jgi:hypothetical protein